MKTQKRDPSPEEIAAACLEIQSTWTPSERLRRLRADLRPQVATADGRLVDISADAYSEHHAKHDTAAVVDADAVWCERDEVVV